MEYTSYSRLESVKASVREDTFDVSDMKTQPVAVRQEWDNIFRYSTQDCRLPGPYYFARFYKTQTGQHLCTKAQVTRSIDNLMVYIPTKGHLSLALLEAKQVTNAIENPFGCAQFIKNPSHVEERLNESMEYKLAIQNIINWQLYGACVAAVF